MPPKAAAGGEGKAGKMYSADVVAAVLYATGTTSLSMKHYELMSSLDEVKTASAFQHDFRAVIAKAKELKARADSGEQFEPVQPSAKRGTYCCCVCHARRLHFHCWVAVATSSHSPRTSRQQQGLLIKRCSSCP